MMEVKYNRDVAFTAKRQQILDRECARPVIIFQRQPLLAVVAQLLEVDSKPLQGGFFILIHPTNMNVDFVPVAGLVTHQVKYLQHTFLPDNHMHPNCQVCIVIDVLLLLLACDYSSTAFCN